MSDEIRILIPLICEEDSIWRIALISGDAIGWNFRRIPYGRDDLLPH